MWVRRIALKGVTGTMSDMPRRADRGPCCGGESTVPTVAPVHRTTHYRKGR